MQESNKPPNRNIKKPHSSNDSAHTAQPRIHRLHQWLTWCIRDRVPASSGMLRRRLPRREPGLHRPQRLLLHGKDRRVDSARGCDEVRAVEPVRDCKWLPGRAVEVRPVRGKRGFPPRIPCVARPSQVSTTAITGGGGGTRTMSVREEQMLLLHEPSTVRLVRRVHVRDGERVVRELLREPVRALPLVVLGADESRDDGWMRLWSALLEEAYFIAAGHPIRQSESPPAM